MNPTDNTNLFVNVYVYPFHDQIQVAKEWEGFLNMETQIKMHKKHNI